MRNSFNASVPARKPKTTISRVLTELTSETIEDGDAREEDVLHLGIDDRTDEPSLEVVEAPDRPVVVETSARLVATEEAPARPVVVETSARPVATEETPPRPLVVETSTRPVPAEAPGRAVTAEAPARPLVAEPPTAAPVSQDPPRRTAASAIAASRDRLAALRERLTIATQPPQATPEPRSTAEAVRQLIEDLRARLEAAAAENAQVRQEMEQMRETLARAELQAERERRLRAELEAKSEEGRSIADDLLEEAEAALDQFRAERDDAVRKLNEANQQVDLRLAEIADLESRIHAEVAERGRAEARARELASEVERLNEAMEALEEIQGMVGRRR